MTQQTTADVVAKTIPTAPVNATKDASYVKCCEGSWIACINPFHNPIGEHFYFRHLPSCKHFDRNDVAKICPTCWGQAYLLNHPLEQTPLPNRQNSWQKHSQSKAGPDLL